MTAAGDERRPVAVPVEASGRPVRAARAINPQHGRLSRCFVSVHQHRQNSPLVIMHHAKGRLKGICAGFLFWS
jgi:hypothetical protein